MLAGCHHLDSQPQQDHSHHQPQGHPHPQQCCQSQQHSLRGPMTNRAARAQAAAAVETKLNPHLWWRPPGSQPAPRQGAPCWVANTTWGDYRNSHTTCQTSSSSHCWQVQPPTLLRTPQKTCRLHVAQLNNKPTPEPLHLTVQHPQGEEQQNSTTALGTHQQGAGHCCSTRALAEPLPANLVQPTGELFLSSFCSHRCYDPGDGSHSFIGNQAAGQARGHHGSQVTNQ